MHIVEFIGRILLSALFLIEGLGKVSAQENVVMYMEDYGVLGILFVPATILEILFPLFLMVGYKTKWAASVMALFTFAVAIIFHTDFDEGMQMIFFLKDIAIAGGFMIIIVYGPGKISLDHYFNSKQELNQLIKKNQKIFTNFLNRN